MTGVIKRIMHIRGFGFILDENGEDRFLHVKDLEDSRLWPSLQEGQRLSFEPYTRKQKGNHNGLGVTCVKLL